MVFCTCVFVLFLYCCGLYWFNSFDYVVVCLGVYFVVFLVWLLMILLFTFCLFECLVCCIVTLDWFGFVCWSGL